MNDKKLILFWGGLLGLVVAIFLMNNWIKGQLEESPSPSQQVVRPANIPAAVPSVSPVAEVVADLTVAEDVLAVDLQKNAEPQQDEPEDPNPVYETPLISPILQQ